MLYLVSSHKTSVKQLTNQIEHASIIQNVILAQKALFCAKIIFLLHQMSFFNF